MHFNYLVLCLLLHFALGKEVFLNKEEASQYLRRSKRSNTIFEELQQGNAERECVEETCNYEEAREVFEDDDLTREYWKTLRDQCSTPTNQCNVNGTLRCQNKYRGYTCVCSPGYIGDFCETVVDRINVCEMYDFLCVNGGTCVDDEENSYYCDCPAGWYGRDCVQDIDECEEVPCVHGQCLNHFGAYQCNCDKGYEGVNCDKEVNECDLGFCPAGTVCVDGLNSFTCECPSEGCFNLPEEDEDEAEDYN